MKKLETIIGGVKITFEVYEDTIFNEVIKRQKECENWDWSSVIHLKEEAKAQLDDTMSRTLKDNFNELESIVEEMAWHEYLINVVNEFDTGQRKDDTEGFKCKMKMLEEEDDVIRKMMEPVNE